MILKTSYQDPKYDTLYLKKKLNETYHWLKPYGLALRSSNFEVLMLCNKVPSAGMDSMISKVILTLLLEIQRVLHSELSDTTNGNEKL